MITKKQCLEALGKLGINVEGCIEELTLLQGLINEHFEETAIKLEEVWESKAVYKTLCYKCQKCKAIVNDTDLFCCKCGRRIKNDKARSN